MAKAFHVGGEGGWDYITVDDEHHKLYVTRSTHTMILDELTGKTIADIPGQQRNHGVALAPALGRGFITDGKDGSVTIFDLATNRVLGTVKAAEDADAIVFDAATGKVFISCGDAAAVVAIAADVDPVKGKADATVALGGKPEALLADGKGKIFVNLEDKNEVVVVDSKAMKVVARYPTSPGGAPVGLAMDAARRRLFIGCRNPQKLIVMNADDGNVLADLPIGAGVDAARFDDGYFFASCRDGTLAVAKETSPGKFEIVQTVHTQPGARTMDVNHRTHTLYLPTAEMTDAKDPRGRPIPKANSFMVQVVERTLN
ncbi:MAG: YncE family protein [Planctomycetes bacterium]|nr:YncE family protein [Planctomycetota bacterium]